MFTLAQAMKAQKWSSSTPSLTSALDGVGGQRDAPVALPPGKTRYQLHRMLSGPQSCSGRVLKISPLNGIRFLDRPFVHDRVLQYQPLTTTLE